MIPFIILLPAKVINLLESNVSPSEIAAGVCLGMFLGFIPLNGPMAIFLFILFLLIKLNRLSTVLTLPLFKLFYVLGLSHLADRLGEYLLINAEYLTYFWRFVTNLPIVSYLEVNHTLVAGGLALSLALTMPVFFVSRSIIGKVKYKFAERIRSNKFVKWFKKLPLVESIGSAVKRIRGEE